MKLNILFLTCANRKEAEKIASKLLDKRFIVCAKRFPVRSSFLWQGKIGKAEEVMLVMDSVEENFQKIKKEVALLHSYDTPVLLSSPVVQTTKEVEDWIKQEIVK